MYFINIFCYILVHMQNGTLTHASTSYDQQPAKDQASGLRDMLKYYNVNMQLLSKYLGIMKVVQCCKYRESLQVTGWTVR